METKALDNLLGQLRAAASLAAGNVAANPKAGGAKEGRSVDFADVLKSSLDHVNSHQNQAAQLARDFEMGASHANLHEVMISLQKANISFQQMVQVRNRLVSAYHDIMNMQV